MSTHWPGIDPDDTRIRRAAEGFDVVTLHGVATIRFTGNHPKPWRITSAAAEHRGAEFAAPAEAVDRLLGPDHTIRHPGQLYDFILAADPGQTRHLCAHCGQAWPCDTAVTLHDCKQSELCRGAGHCLFQAERDRNRAHEETHRVP